MELKFRLTKPQFDVVTGRDRQKALLREHSLEFEIEISLEDKISRKQQIDLAGSKLKLALITEILSTELICEDG